MTLTWYDGGLMPPDPEELEGEQLNAGGGILYVGKKGKLLQDGDHAAPAADVEAQLVRRAEGTAVARAARRSRDELDQRHQGQGPALVPTSSTRARLTEIMLLGIAALRANSKLHYDGANMRVTNNAAANEFLTREYRKGYSL